MKLKNTFLKQKLIYLGFHIGHSIINNSYNFKLSNTFLEGSRNRYNIFNVNLTIFFLQKSIFFFKNLSRNFGNILFFYSYVDNNFNFNLMVKLFLKKKLLCQTGASFVSLKWIPGIISNYNICFLRFIKFLIKKISLSKKIIITYNYKKKKSRFLNRFSNDKLFSILFFKILFLLEEQLILNEKTDLYAEFKKISHLIRLIIFLRFWKSFFWIPDLCCSLSSKDSTSPIKEFSSLKIPVVSTCDSVSTFNDISYPIPINDDTIITTLFLVSLFSNILKKEHLLKYI